MDYQFLFNIALSAVAFLSVWIFTLLWETVKGLKAMDDKIATEVKRIEMSVVTEYSKRQDVEVAMARILEKVERIENIELLLVSQYVNKSEFTKSLDNFSAKLDKISEQLGHKADKMSF